MELAIEATGTTERWVDGVGSVGGADYQDAVRAVHAVHLGEQRRNERVEGVRVARFLIGRATRRDAVDFVDEDDRRAALVRLLEKQTHLALRITEPFAQDVGALHHEEGNLLSVFAALVGQCAR